MILNRNSYLPLYVQIRQELHRLVQERLFGGDRTFPSDAELAERFHVSRMTVRQAISELVSEGSLIRVRGTGTFVASPKITERLSPLGNFFRSWPDQGVVAHVEILALEPRPCPLAPANLLRIPEGTPIVYLLRRRVAGSSPIAIDHRYFSEPIGRCLSRDDLSRLAIHTIVTTRLAIAVATARIELEAIPASDTESRMLEVPRSAPLLARTATVFSRSGEALWTGTSFYRGDAYKYALQVPVPQDHRSVRERRAVEDAAPASGLADDPGRDAAGRTSEVLHSAAAGATPASATTIPSPQRRSKRPVRSSR